MNLIELPGGELLNTDALYSIRFAVVRGDTPKLTTGWMGLDEVQLLLRGEVRAVATSVAGTELVLVRVPVSISTTVVISDYIAREKVGHITDCIDIAWRGPEVELAICDAKAQARKLLEGDA